MRTVCFAPGRYVVLALFIAVHLPVVGCNDESKTDGTMVQVSEAEKERLKTKREAYKATRATIKSKAVAKKP